MIKLIDSHAHLLSQQYDDDRTSVIKRSKETLEAVIEVGCDVSSFEPVIQLAKEHPNFIYPALGIHPTNCEEYNNDVEAKLIKYAQEKIIVAIGEIGIDMYWHPETLEKQIEVFGAQIEIAKKYDLPIIVHCRDAFNECIEVLKAYAPLRGVMHSFSGDVMQAQEVIETGLILGLSGPITFKNGETQRQVAKEIDLKKIIVETDAPYLTPVPYRGKRNEPNYVIHVAEAIAIEKHTTTQKIIEQTTFNVKELFMKGINV